MKSYKFIKIVNISLLFLSFITFIFFALKHNSFAYIQSLLLFASLFVPLLIKYFFKINIPVKMQIIYFIFLIAHFLLGEIFSFYIIVKHYDTVFHFLTASYITILGFYIINYFLKNEHFNLQLLFAFLFGVVAEYIWELIEYIIDDTFKTNMQRYMYDNIKLLGHFALYDTMKDMFITMFGCIITIIILKIKKEKIKKAH